MRENQELRLDIKDCLNLQKYASDDLMYFNKQNDLMKGKIKELESALLKQYVPEIEIQKTLDLLLKFKQESYRDVYVTVAEFDVYDTKRLLRLIQKICQTEEEDTANLPGLSLRIQQSSVKSGTTLLRNNNIINHRSQQQFGKRSVFTETPTNNK